MGIVQRRCSTFSKFVVTRNASAVTCATTTLSCVVRGSPGPVIVANTRHPVGLSVASTGAGLSSDFCCTYSSTSRKMRVIFSKGIVTKAQTGGIQAGDCGTFSDVSFPCLTIVRSHQVLQCLPVLPCRGPIQFCRGLDSDIFLLGLVPNVRPILLPMVFRRCSTVVIRDFNINKVPSDVGSVFCRLYRGCPRGVVILYARITRRKDSVAICRIKRRVGGLYGMLRSCSVAPRTITTGAV